MRASLLIALAAWAAPALAQNEAAWRDSSEAYWAGIEAEFRDSALSPMTPEHRLHFEHLDRFPYDPAFRVVARFKPAKKPKEFAMKTSTNRTPTYRTVGQLIFKLEGHSFKLPVYQNVDLSKKPEYANYLFLPFTDLTNGEETYGGGRYVDLQGPHAENVVVDLNKAYNPYCAYSGRYSCPIPPLENHIAARITAGVKKFHD